MERFVFVAAVTIAIIFGVVAMFGGGPHFNFGVDVDAHGTAPVMEVAPGSMEAQAFAGSELRIRSAAANVTIIPEDRSDFLIEIDNTAGRAPMPTVSAEGALVTIDGQLRGRIQDCDSGGGVSLRGYGDLASADLPHITIHAPRGLELDRSGAGATEIGATQSLDLDFSGCGAANLGDVADDLNLDFSGSGAVTVGAVGSLNADIAGSGELNTGAIARSADIDIAGSGNLNIASLTGDLSTDSAGSANIEVRAGAIGRADIDLAGSGNIDITAPVRELVVSMVGAGDVTVDGEVGDLEVEIAGAGSVNATRVSGHIRQEIFGPGEVNVGARGAQNAP